MVRYRGARVPDGTFFFTLTLRNRRSDLLVRRIDASRDAWKAARDRVPNTAIAAVVLKERWHDEVGGRLGAPCASPRVESTSVAWRSRDALGGFGLAPDALRLPRLRKLRLRSTNPRLEWIDAPTIPSYQT